MTAEATARDAIGRDQVAVWRPVRVGEWRWLLRPDIAHDLHDDPALEFSNDVRLTVVKRGPHRTIRRMTTAAGEFYLKQFHQPDWSTWLRHWLRGSQARWEFSRYRHAVERDIPTAEVVGLGQAAAWGGESGLITRAIPAVAPLDEYLAAHAEELPLPRRRQLAASVAEVLARMHRRGAIHRDLHAGNLLIRDEDHDFRVWIIDLSPLRFQSEPVDWSVIAQNLGRLRHSVLRQLGLSDQTAFFRAYWREFHSGDATAPSNRRRGLREVARRCESVARSCWDQMDRKWARGNRKIIIVRTPTVHIRAVAEVGREVVEAMAINGDLCSGPVSPALGERARVRGLPATLPSHIGPIRVTWQTRRNLNVGWVESPRPTNSPWSIGGPRRASTHPTNTAARHDWEIGHALHRRLIAVPVPVCMIERREADHTVETLALRHDAEWRPLDVSLPADIRAIGNRCVDLLRRLHSFHFSHLALTPAAFEMRCTSARLAVRFCRLDQIHRCEILPQSRRLAELHSLATSVSAQRPVPLTMWLCWLQRYLGRAQRPHWKTDWRMMAALTTTTSTRRAA